MGLPELAGRSRQEAAKWLDRAGVTRVRRYPGVDADRLHASWPRRFFPDDGVVDRAEGTTATLTRACDRVIAEADRTCAGRFDLLGYRDLAFGDPIDWHLDPVNGRRSPRVHWSRIDPLDVPRVGDSKIVWELNRHQWLVRLGLAYRLTGDERLAAVCAKHLYAWMRDNPPGVGINWASSLEAALRLIAWCWVIHLFRPSGAIRGGVIGDLLSWAAIHAAHVEKYLSYYFSPNTHLTGEALGLYYAGVVLREHDRADAWRALATRILTQQVDDQVHEDGVYFEQSTYYQRYTIEIYLHFLILAARNGQPLPPRVAERVQAMLDVLLALQAPDGSMPQIGDADGGWILPVEPRRAGDLRGVFSTAAAVFGRRDYAWAAGELALETALLLGARGQRRFEALEPAPPDRSPSGVFVEGGYVVMRSGWHRDAHQLIVDVGPLGCRHSAGHGHADLLSVQCAAFGDPVLVDPGTGSYAAGWRSHFRSTAAHSTVVVDDRGQSEPAGPFRWHSRPRATLRRWISTSAYDMAEADHDAYAGLADPVTHRRRVIFVKPHYWIIVDDLIGAAEHQIEVGFQCAAAAGMTSDDEWVRAGGSRGRGLAIGAWSSAALARSIAAGATQPARGWVSPEYGQWQPAPRVSFSAVTRLPLRIVSALVPFETPCSTLPTQSELLSCVALLES
jgi:hypothetical protein